MNENSNRLANRDLRPSADAPVAIRRPMPHSTISKADVRLDLSYRYWLGLRSDHCLLPNRGGLDHAAFRFLVDGTIWINVESADPTNWDLIKTFGRTGQILPEKSESASNDKTKSVDPETQSSAQTIATSADPLCWRDVIMADCRTTRFTGTVLFQRIELAHGGQPFDQLLLPLADDGVRVDTILIVQAPATRCLSEAALPA